jgi:hypothetical protein
MQAQQILPLPLIRVIRVHPPPRRDPSPSLFNG